MRYLALGFRCSIDSIDTFTLESDVDTQLFQFTNILKAVLGVAGKAGDGFDKDLIDQAPTAIRHHPLEVIPLSHRSSGDSLVRILLQFVILIGLSGSWISSYRASLPQFSRLSKLSCQQAFRGS